MPSLTKDDSLPKSPRHHLRVATWFFLGGRSLDGRAISPGGGAGAGAFSLLVHWGRGRTRSCPWSSADPSSHLARASLGQQRRAHMAALPGAAAIMPFLRRCNVRRTHQLGGPRSSLAETTMRLGDVAADDGGGHFFLEGKEVCRRDGQEIWRADCTGPGMKQPRTQTAAPPGGMASS